MSAFVCVLDRSGAPLDPALLRRLAEPLADYGGELATLCRGPVGIALRHRGGPSGSVALDRHGPVVEPTTGRAAALAGWFHRLGGGTGSAAAALAALQGWQDEGPVWTATFLGGLWGSFTLVAADPARASVEIARDHLGDLKVYYHLDDRWLVAATEAAAVLAHDAVTDALDEASAARFLGFRFGHGERSFFRDVRELPPAHRLRVTATGARTERYWRFPGPPAGGALAPEEVPGELARRLERALAGHLAGREPARVGLSLSGGLDSTALAALAPPGVQAFSWYFEGMPDADERAAVEAVSRHLALPVHWLRGDGLHPLCGEFAERFVHPGSPYLNPFAALKCRLYEAARAAGCERMLVGDGGDALYGAREYWLRDLLADRQPGALRSLARALRDAARGDRLARLGLARLLPVRGAYTALRGGPAPWLTAAGRAALPADAPSPILPAGRRGARHELVAGSRNSELESEERRLFARCGVERGNPFWSWPLVELALHLPAYRSYRDGRTKALAREMLRGRLPERIVESPRTGMLGALFLRGLELRRDELREILFRHPRSDWRSYVRRDWLEPYLDQTGAIAFGHTILWRVVSYELWHRRLIGGDLLP